MQPIKVKNIGAELLLLPHRQVHNYNLNAVTNDAVTQAKQSITVNSIFLKELIESRLIKRFNA